MKKRLIVTAFAPPHLALLTGCAFTPRHGAVVMKASDTEAHVALNARDVAVGGWGTRSASTAMCP